MKPTAYQRRVAEGMLDYVPNPFARRRFYPQDLTGWGGSKAAGRLLERSPNAFFFGMLFDIQVRAEKAYSAPLQLRQRLGHLNVRWIAQMSERSLKAKIEGSEKGESLHRFPARMARTLLRACNKLVADYGGRASNIWRDGDAPSIRRRLDEFHGVGSKLERMMPMLLGRWYGVRLRRLDQLDVAVDRHVARVFLRTGLVSGPTRGQTEVRVASLATSVTDMARVLSPGYPGALDAPAWDVAKEWCTQQEAWCDYPDEPCPLHKVCRKDRTHLRVV